MLDLNDLFDFAMKGNLIYKIFCNVTNNILLVYSIFLNKNKLIFF